MAKLSVGHKYDPVSRTPGSSRVHQGWDLRLLGIAKATDENVATFSSRWLGTHAPHVQVITYIHHTVQPTLLFLTFAFSFVSEALSMLSDVALDQFSYGTRPR